jgi:20S proteasome alpha/beta subunit
MSFLIAVHVNKGIVLASDRRTTYTNTQSVNDKVIERIGIHTTNSTDKTFVCPNGAGISTCGDASLYGKPINYMENL